MYPRLTAAMERELPGKGALTPRKRTAMTVLARRRRSPGLLAYSSEEPVGWIAIAPRGEYARIEASRATPRVDDEDVWVIPCITVRQDMRGRGIALALIRAAVEYAWDEGAPAVECYPRSGSDRAKDGSVYIGSEELFRRAGFHVLRAPLPGLPRNWTPRVTMRLERE